MINNLLSSLSLLMITNGTIESSILLRNQYNLNLAILPRSSLSITTFKNVWFKKIELIHFSPITFNSCRFGSSSVFIQSKETLIIQSCANISGYIRAEGSDIYVNSSSLSENFSMFNLLHSHGNFHNSKFTTKSNKPVITCSNSAVNVQNCIFSECDHGGIVTLLKSNLTVSNSIFNKMGADEGGAINFDGDELIANKCIFSHCKAAKSGGALKIAGRLNSTFSSCSFRFNKSPQGNSIYLLKSSGLVLNDCFISSGANEIYNYRKPNMIKKVGPPQSGDKEPDNPSPRPTPISSNYFSISNQFSQSSGFTTSNSFTKTIEFSQSSSFTPSVHTTLPQPTEIPDQTSTPFPTASFIDRSSNRSTKYLTFVIIICAAVVVIAIVAVTAILLQKRKSQIYPSDYDGEDEEPKKTTVIISNINDDDL